MKKIIVTTLLTCLILTGCNNANNTNNAANEVAPIEQPAGNDQDNTIVEDEAPVIEEEPATDEGTKEAYIQKLDDVEASLVVDLKKLNDEGTTVSMTAAAEETYKRWDTALNEIYAELKVQLSTSEMDKLKEEQLKWITLRDETAKKASLAYEGGTMESLEYMATQARLTKERSYELVELYMK